MSIEKAKELLQDARRLAFKGRVVQLIEQALTKLDKPDTRIAELEKHNTEWKRLHDQVVHHNKRLEKQVEQLQAVIKKHNTEQLEQPEEHKQ